MLLSFHVGDESRLKTQGYGGHAMKVHVHRRQPAQVSAWLDGAGFTVEAQMTLSSAESPLGGFSSRVAGPTVGGGQSATDIPLHQLPLGFGELAHVSSICSGSREAMSQRGRLQRKEVDWTRARG